MRGIPAQQRLKSGLFLVFALTASLGLAACSDIDEALFGDDTSGMAASDMAPPDAGAPPPSAAYAAPAAPSAGGLASIPTITPIVVEAGSDTGTAVNKTIQTIRGQIAGLQQKLVANAGRLAALRGNGAAAAAAYHEAKAHITTRLQVGTTRGNPELVGEWNSAQAQLDSLSTNINALNALGTDITNDSSTAHYALDQISATYNVSGAVDEDHRQLSLLEDETSQTIVLVDRLLKEVSDDVQRQTAYVANERAQLTTLAASIKSGELYSSGLAAPAAAGGPLAAAGSPLVVIKFDHPGVDYQQILYAALNQALQNRPSAGFQVVAVSPTKGNAAAVQIAQTTARRHAQDVMRSMTDMGVPATRLDVASTTDPSATASEVRVFVR